ncbi:MAG: peptide chain release factor aRF-1 [Candidatus Diapherotrites archaeon]|nr:peptide chain release factor aRF-1 [Candidatus Diapherotrites archaeon]
MGAPHHVLEEVSEADMAVFKKKLKMLEAIKGRHTELITQYIPPETDRSTVMNQLSEEINQSGNIKSASTRKNVQGALRKIIVFLKNINFKLPQNGIVVFAGNVSESEGRADIRLFTVIPVRPLKVKLYWCDSAFHIDHLKEMMAPNDFYAIMTIDKNEATVAQLVGKKYEILGHFTSMVPGKTRAGGQSSQRFERLREEATQDFFKKSAEKFNTYFEPYIPRIKGVLIGGPGMTKNYFMEKKVIHHELEKKILGVVDTAYTDEGGIRELVHKSQDLLKDSELIKERQILEKFLGEVAKDGLATYGQIEVEKAIEDRRVSTLIISEDIPWSVFRIFCEHCQNEEITVIKDITTFEESKLRCPKCDSKVETTEEITYLDYLIYKAKELGAVIRVISTETNEGKNFFEGFGGIAALLRYKA